MLQTPSGDGSAIVETVTFAEHIPTAALTVATDDQGQVAGDRAMPKFRFDRLGLVSVLDTVLRLQRVH